MRIRFPHHLTSPVNTATLAIAVALCALLLAPLPVGVSDISADQSPDEFPFMQPDDETLQQWLSDYESAPVIEMERGAAEDTGGSRSLLNYLDYTPASYSQGSCGNCWAWAGTSCLGIALDVQRDIHDRLSVQHINSCEYDVIGKTCCRGGWLSDFANFYDSTGYCIPWSNAGAYWQDGDAACDVPCDSITTTPQYPILSIDDFTVPTHASEGIVDREAAISSIKSVLNQDRAVWFAFFVPTPSAWSTFTSFWLNNDEESLITMDSICSGSAPYCGHAVLCVGYNDEDPDNRYWVMLNSWSTAGGNRPNGLFRINMDMDYDCRCGIQSFYWQTLEVSFGLLPDIEVAPSSLSCTVLQNQSEEMDFSISNNGEGPLEYTLVDGADDGVGGTTVDISYDDGTPESSSAGDTGTRYAVRFSPTSYPARLLSADVHLWQETPQWPDDDHEEFGIEVYDDDGPGGIPGTLLGGTTATPTDWDWCTIDLSALDVNVNEGAVYVAFQYLTDAPDCEALSFDETAPEGHSWQRASNETWLPVEMAAAGPGNWLIRCSMEEMDCLWLSENPESGTVAPGDSNEITVTVDATGLAPGEQGASVLVCSNDPESNTVTLPVSVTVLPAADLVPTILCAEWDDVASGVYTITLAVANEGFGNAGTSVAKLFIDSVEAAQYAVPALGPGESFSTQFGPVTLSEGSDDLSLVVDTDDEVSPESSEVNNHVSQTVGQPMSAQVQFTLQPGWNMVSVPLLLDDNATSSVFPNSEAVYTWNPAAKSYFMPATIEPGFAYWVAVVDETIVTVDGLAVTEYLSDLTPGWHMLGSVQGTAADFSNPHDAPSGGVEDFAYHWDPVLKSYVQAVSLEEGAGYWIAAMKDCLLEVS